MTFRINDRVKLTNQHIDHYGPEDICTVMEVSGCSIGVYSDSDATEGYYWVSPASLIHVTNVPSVRPSAAAPAASIVDRPSHYTKWVIEPITFIQRNGMEFWRGNIIKYTARAGAKQYDGMSLVESEITDLEKVRRYAEMRINELKGCDDF